MVQFVLSDTVGDNTGGVSSPWSAFTNFNLSLWIIIDLFRLRILVIAGEIIFSTRYGPSYGLSYLCFFTYFFTKTRSFLCRFNGLVSLS